MHKFLYWLISCNFLFHSHILGLKFFYTLAFQKSWFIIQNNKRRKVQALKIISLIFLLCLLLSSFADLFPVVFFPITLRKSVHEQCSVVVFRKQPLCILGNSPNIITEVCHILSQILQKNTVSVAPLGPNLFSIHHGPVIHHYHPSHERGLFSQVHHTVAQCSVSIKVILI